MKVFLFFLLALAGCKARAQTSDIPDEYFDEITEQRYQAWSLVYTWAMYDFDVGVWGHGNTYIAPSCNGTKVDGSCNFNEYMNFILLGEATETPFYYELQSGFSLQIGTVQQLVDALLITIKTWKELSLFPHSPIPDRKTWKGLWKDLGHVYEQQMDKGRKAGKNIAVHATKLEMIMGGVNLYSKGLFQRHAYEYLKSYLTDVQWQVASQYDTTYKTRFPMVDWETMVKKYPDLKNPSSSLFKDVKTHLTNWKKLSTTRSAETESRAQGNTMNMCIKGSLRYA